MDARKKLIIRKLSDLSLLLWL